MKERAQHIVSQWRSVIPPEHATPQAEFQRSLEEVEELKKAIENDDGSTSSHHDIASEAGDVIIRMLGVVESVGGNAEQIVFEKLEHTTRIKYPRDIIQHHMENGMDWPEAMNTEKTLFEGNRGWGMRWQKRVYRHTEGHESV